MYCIEDYITVSPARSVFHPRIKLHQNEHLWNTKLHYCWQATYQKGRCKHHHSSYWRKKNKLWNHTWSVGRRLKSLGGFVITYLLPGASGPALLSRNLQGKYSNHCIVEHIFKLLRFCLTLNYLNHFKECCSWNLFKYAEVKNPLPLFNGVFFTILWTFVAEDSIWIYCAMCKKTVFASIDKIC